MKKKIIALTMCLAMAASALVGCGNSETEQAGSSQASESSVESSAETPASEEKSEEAPASDEIIEITFNYTSAKECYTEFIEEWNATEGVENGIKLVMTDLDKDALNIAMENGTAPDFFTPPNLAAAVENGYIVSLEDYPEFTELIEKNATLRNTSSDYNGKLYKIPFESRIYGLAYNKDMFKAAGLVDANGEATPPTTLEEMREYAEILTDASKQQYGIILPVKWSSFFGTCIENTGATAVGMKTYNANTGAYDFGTLKPVMETILAMDDDGSVYPGADGIDNDAARARFAEGNVGMIFAVSWDVSVYNQHLETKCDWGVCAFPSADGNKYATMNVPSWSNCINAQSVEDKGIEKIAIAFNALYSDELMALRYERGEGIPWRADITELVGEVDTKTLVGWDDFGVLVAESMPDVTAHPVDITGYDKNNADFVSKVWSRQYTVDQWIEERNKIYAEGIKNYKTLNPDLDYSIYAADPDYSRLVK